ncbi:MAG: class I SAM-dependent methyltransferase [Bacteroidota bacterium]
MIHKLQMILKYPSWYLKARNRHGIHSPFLYDFIDKCLYAKTSRHLFTDIEQERKRLATSREVIFYSDPGAGPSGSIPAENKTITRSVAQITSSSLTSATYGRLFYRMIRYFNYTKVLEMGTSLGITTSYLAKAGRRVRVVTLEGAEPVAEKASEVFNNLGLTNIALIRGNFESQLPDVLQKENTFDMVFLDGDHKGEKVLKYFDLLVKHIPPAGVVVIDDIRWSSSMNNAWNQIVSHPKVTISLDLYFMGIVFLNPNLSQEQIAVRFP